MSLVYLPLCPPPVMPAIAGITGGITGDGPQIRPQIRFILYWTRLFLREMFRRDRDHPQGDRFGSVTVILISRLGGVLK